MIVDSMTYEEVVAEFRYDWKNYLTDIIQRHIEDNKYRRFVLKQTKDNIPVNFKPITLTSKRGNKYILQINSKGRSDFKKNGPLYSLYMYYHRPEGIYAVLLCSIGSRSFETEIYNIYIPHFFDRYRERELKDIHKPKLETIINFFQKNSTGQYSNIDNPKYKDSIFYTVATGVMLGSIYNDSINELRTYITFEMLRGNQIDTNVDLSTRISEYIEKYQQ